MIPELPREISLNGMPMTLREARYGNGRTAIVVVDAGGNNYLVLTVNMPDAALGPDEIAVKTWSENEDCIPPLLESGYFEDTGKRIPAGWTTAAVWRLTAKWRNPTPRTPGA